MVQTLPIRQGTKLPRAPMTLHLGALMLTRLPRLILRLPNDVACESVDV